MTKIGGRQVFGHPLGLAVLAGTEMWERFSFYGMQYILMLYMTSQLLTTGHEEKVLGLASLRAMMSAHSGISDLTFASRIFGLYSATFYITPLFGSWLGDRRPGRTRMVAVGAVMMALGHFMLATESLFLVALVLLTLGGGAVKGNLLTQVNDLYEDEDPRRTRAFAIYMGAVNIGGLMAGLVCGTLGEVLAWHWGFTAAGVGMLIGLAIYLVGLPFLPAEKDRQAETTAPPWPVANRRARIMLILATVVPFSLVLGVCFQAYATTLIWAKTSVNHRIGGWDMPVTWVTTFDGIMVIVGIAIANRFWRGLEARGMWLHELTKLAIGCGMVITAYVLLSLAAQAPLTPLAQFLLFFVVLDMAFVWIDPPVTAFVARVAPDGFKSQAIALTMLATAGSFALVGWLGQFLEPLGASLFFMLNAEVAAGALLLVLLLRLGLSLYFPSLDAPPISPGQPA